MALFKDLKDLKEELQYWQNYEPVNNMGKTKYCDYAAVAE